MQTIKILSIASGVSLVLGDPVFALGQHVSAGVVGGVSLTEDFRDETITISGHGPGNTGAVGSIHYYSTSKDYIVGAMVQLGLRGS